MAIVCARQLKQDVGVRPAELDGKIGRGAVGVLGDMSMIGCVKLKRHMGNSAR